MKSLALAGFLAALPAMAAPPAATLFDDLVEVAPGQVRSLAVPAQQGPARIACSYRVLGGGEARLLLIPAESMDAWIEGQAYEELAATGYGRLGELTHAASTPRELVLVVQSRNGARRLTRLRLLVRVLDPAVPFPPLPRPAERRRGEILVWSSLGVFAAIAGAGAARLRRLFAARR
jgi:hypothetical protein